MISFVNKQTFFDLLGRLKSGSSEEVFQFPLEYYEGESTIYIYKTVLSKTFKTSVDILDVDGVMGVMIKGETITVVEFIKDLKVNFNGLELLQPLDYEEMIVKHNHDLHTHAGIGYNDVLR